MRYRLLLIDHDDTAVDSTGVIHFPAHREAMRVLRPELAPPTLEDWWLANFEPGIMEHLVHRLRMTPAELEREFAIWRSFTSKRTAPFFAGFRELMKTFKDRGGRLVVVSHSEAANIERDYQSAAGPPVMPDLVFGWDDDPARRKPSPWPVCQALERLGVPAGDALVLDDLRPGVMMARAAGVAAAGAGWAHRVMAIREWMQANCIAFFDSVEDFAVWLLAP